MASCTFFGHRDCYLDLHIKLREVLIDLIKNHGVDFFYVGNQGQFDGQVRTVLKKLKTEYPHIDYTVVLAYMPQKKNEYEDCSDTMLPEGIERVPKRFAISWRNNWMLNHADYVVIYVNHTWGGAAQFAEKAKRVGKTVVSLSDKNL